MGATPPKQGSGGALAVWYEIASEVCDEHDAWMTREHVGERVAVPGFRRGRLYRAVDSAASRDGQARFMFYDVEDASVLWSEVYRGAAGRPSDWSAKMIPQFREMERAAYSVVARLGGGTGGELATIRFVPAGDQTLGFEPMLEIVLSAHPMVIAATLLQSVADALPGSNGVEGERGLLLLLDAADRSALDQAIAAARTALSGIADGELRVQRFALMHLLDHDNGG